MLFAVAILEVLSGSEECSVVVIPSTRLELVLRKCLPEMRWAPFVCPIRARHVASLVVKSLILSLIICTAILEILSTVHNLGYTLFG